MKLTIIPSDNIIVVGGVSKEVEAQALLNLVNPLKSRDEFGRDINAVQWNSDTSFGNIEFYGNSYHFTDPSIVQPFIDLYESVE